MKTNHYFAALAALPLFFSCIRGESKNMEADILTCEIPGMSENVKTAAAITNNTVMVMVFKDMTDLTSLAPEFTLTPGATIVPESGSRHDFTGPIEYTVRSEDGKWSKTYTVSVTDDDVPTRFGFEDWQRSGKYETPYETGPASGVKMLVWSSGNAGYAIVHGKVPADFPTSSTTDSKAGLAVKLETKSTGFSPLPLAAGNLFLGTFDSSSAMFKPLEATKFGIPFNRKPLSLKGWYKYKPGAEVVSSGKVVAGETDQCSIYAFLYEKGSGALVNGKTIKDFGDPRIIAVAEVPTVASDSYLAFDIAFDYTYPTAFEAVKSENYKYYIGIVFSSSHRGGEFIGAVGSTLFVDEVEIVCE